jgi:hypothetical protein
VSMKETTNPSESSATTGSVLKRQFLDLAATWKRERGPHSSSARLAEHPAYQEIIALGPDVVPLLLHELEQEPDHWFRALHALTAANPVPAESRGNLREMAAAWLRWGRQQGYNG